MLVAVFGSLERIGDRLPLRLFTSSSLKRGEFSLARQTYTSLKDFKESVIAPLEGSLGAFVGVSGAPTAVLRNLKFNPPGKSGTGNRSICVIDKVAAGDHEGHAALQYSAALEALGTQISPQKLGTIRTAVHADLVDAFSEINELEKVLTS